MSQTVSIHYRFKVIGMFLLFFTVGYGFTNRFPVFTPVVLPSTTLDDILGFHPWTAWIYMSDYLLIFLPVILVTRIPVMKRIVKGFLLDFMIHFPIFFFFPTTVSRVPLPEDGFTNQIFGFVRWIDQPINCFPSQHVSLCFVVAMSFWHYRKNISLLFFVWAILISISTMTTKQHVFADVVGGIGVALIVWFFVFRKKYPHDAVLVAPTQ